MMGTRENSLSLTIPDIVPLMLAAAEDTTVQALLDEAIEKLLSSRGE